MLDDAHDGSPAQADTWLQNNVAPLLNQPFFQAGGDGLLIITFDNGDRDNQGRVYTAVIGPNVIPHTASNIHYMHENALKTILLALGITPFPEDKPINGTINPPAGDWGQCTNTSCGKPAAQMSLTHNTNVSLDGASIDSFNSGNPYWGVLNFFKNGQQDTARNYEVDWSFMTDTDWSNVQALEFDFPASITISGQPLWFYFGTRCDRISGQWHLTPVSQPPGRFLRPGFFVYCWSFRVWVVPSLILSE